jgi:methylated-DNA-protein-cysteine methyltransferase-like protein
MKNRQAEKVYELTRAIPVGKVATYKQLAQLAGIPNPRQVGHIMHLNPYQNEVPCHRVVSSSGKVAVTFAFGGLEAQKRLLEKEGVQFTRGKIDLNKYLWNPLKN